MNHEAKSICLSHTTDEVAFSYQHCVENVLNKKLPNECEALSLLKHLSEFDLGRFLLMNKGLNGYWTSYVILKPFKRKTSLHLNNGL